MSDKSKNKEKYTTKEIEEVFQSELDKKGSIINMVYDQILGTAHPATKAIVKDHMMEAIKTGLGLRDTFVDIENDPDKKKAFQQHMQSMKSQLNSAVKTPGQSLWEEQQKEKKDK